MRSKKSVTGSRTIARLAVLLALAPTAWCVSAADRGDGLATATVVSLRDDRGLETVVEELDGNRDDVNPTAHGLRPVGQTERWQLYSTVQDNEIVIWHVPKVAAVGATDTRDRLQKSSPPVLRSRWSMSSLAAPMVRHPSWWPRLSNPWLRQSSTSGGRVTTMLGWHHGGLDATRRLVSAAVQAGGFHLVRHVPVPGHAERVAAVLMIFAARGSELVLTLTQEPHRVGVVAHRVQYLASDQR